MVDEPIPEPHLRRLAEHVTSDGQLVDVFGKRRQHQPGFLLPFQFALWSGLLLSVAAVLAQFVHDA